MSQEHCEDHREGHRQRIRQRFLEQGLEGIRDYEALELLLTFVARQRDMKPVAKELIDRFGSFKNVLDAAPEALQEIGGVGPAGATLIPFVKQAAARYLQQISRERFSPSDPRALIEYCIVRLGAEPNETFRVICLDSNFATVAVFPRRVIEIALEARASTLVFIHNHPDGNVEPSEADKTLTRALVLAAKTVGIGVYDHVVVSRDTAFSFRDHGLL